MRWTLEFDVEGDEQEVDQFARDVVSQAVEDVRCGNINVTVHDFQMRSL